MDAEPRDAASAEEDLSALIVRRLAELDRNQAWLARTTEIPLATINAWVRRTRGGDGRVDPDRLRKVGDALGVTAAEAFEAAGRRAPGPLNEEREQKLLRLYRQMPTALQRALIEQAETMAKIARAS
jgi:hypothetical protein